MKMEVKPLLERDYSRLSPDAAGYQRAHDERIHWLRQRNEQVAKISAEEEARLEKALLYAGCKLPSDGGSRGRHNRNDSCPGGFEERAAERLSDTPRHWCSRCVQFKPLEDFNRNRHTFWMLQSWCRECSQQKHSPATIRKAKLLARIEPFGQCLICGWNGWSGALEFHHVEEKNKDIIITRDKLRDCYWEIDRACTVLCSNCHRMVHGGQITCDWEPIFTGRGHRPVNIEWVHTPLDTPHVARFETLAGVEVESLPWILLNRTGDSLRDALIARQRRLERLGNFVEVRELLAEEWAELEADRLELEEVARQGRRKERRVLAGAGEPTHQPTADEQVELDKGRIMVSLDYDDVLPGGENWAYYDPGDADRTPLGQDLAAARVVQEQRIRVEFNIKED